MLPPLAARDVKVHLDDRPMTLVWLSIFGPFFALVLLCNRVYWRFKLSLGIGWDDEAMILSMFFLIAEGAVNLAAVYHGYGTPFNTLPYDDAVKALLLFWLGQIFYKLTVNLTKIAIVWLYIRVFYHLRWFQIICWCFFWFIVAAMVSFISATIFQCWPVEAFWERFYASGKCINVLPLWYANGVYNVATDILLVMVVPPIVWTMKVTTSAKLLLVCLFGLGLIVCLASVLRITTLRGSAHSGDITAGSLKSTVWTTAEASLGVICACLPMLRQTIEIWYPDLFPSGELIEDENRPTNPSPAVRLRRLRHIGRRRFCRRRGATAEDHFTTVSDSTEAVAGAPGVGTNNSHSQTIFATEAEAARLWPQVTFTRDEDPSGGLTLLANGWPDTLADCQRQAKYNVRLAQEQREERKAEERAARRAKEDAERKTAAAAFVAANPPTPVWPPVTVVARPYPVARPRSIPRFPVFPTIAPRLSADKNDKTNNLDNGSKTVAMHDDPFADPPAPNLK